MLKEVFNYSSNEKTSFLTLPPFWWYKRFTNVSSAIACFVTVNNRENRSLTGDLFASTWFIIPYAILVDSKKTTHDVCEIVEDSHRTVHHSLLVNCMWDSLN